jgi:hypothetical protein
MVRVYSAPQFVRRLANPQNSARLALLNPKRCESWVKAVHRLLCQGFTDVVDADLSKYLDAVS